MRILSAGAEFKWIGVAPNSKKRFSLLIPQYNEGSHCDINKRLAHFNQLANDLSAYLDVIIIDDGSTDDSLLKITEFKKLNHAIFYIAAIYPNANKVGAIHLTTLAVHYSVLVLSDFDTDIHQLEKVVGNIDFFNRDEKLMGCYFRMLPFEGDGNVFNFQQLEYSLARSMYKFHQKDFSVPVMPGAGSCYKREVLLSIFNEHSGLRSGEDREATLIGLRLGYKTIYMDQILTLTRPPLSFRSLVKQRIRWNIGYLETLSKEYQYYARQIGKLTPIGIRTLIDLIQIVFTLLLPISILILTILDVSLFFLFFLIIYFGTVAWWLLLIIVSPGESKEFKSRRLYFIFKFPVFKFSLDYCAWTGAIVQFFKKYHKRNRRR